MRAHIVNSLRPAYLVKQEENRKKKAQMDEEKKKSNESLQREQDSGSKAKTDGESPTPNRFLQTLLRRLVRAAERKIVRPIERVARLKRNSAQPGRNGSRGCVFDGLGCRDGRGCSHTFGSACYGEGCRASNLELNSLQQGLEELTSRPDSDVNDGDTSGASMTDAAPFYCCHRRTHRGTSRGTGRDTSSTSERVTTTINGNEVDITDSGIDPTFLEALPEDMREEVLNQHFRERRAAEAAARAVAGGGSSTRQESSSIAPEFLEALPPEIRAEVIQQEAVENQRRRREERRGEDTSARGPSDIDPASFLASLNPDLRGAVLMEQDQSFLNSMPAVMRQEVEEMRNTSQRLADSQRELHRRYGRNGGLPGLPNSPTQAPRLDLVRVRMQNRARSQLPGMRSNS
ncbi:hypothetical protein L7F22_004371 [Adiantum nelumboides]|nr:hypothetical protein [Adiantum nelumboides]